MKKQHQFLLVLLLAFISSIQSSYAEEASVLGVVNKSREEGETLRLSNFNDTFEVHADAAISNIWFDHARDSIAFGSGYRLITDYRAEGKANLYTIEANKRHNEIRGSLVARTEGFAILDEDVDIFQDRLIDLPEIFWRNDTEFKGNEVTFVFGKFANRRFLDKDEIAPDNFDIGERFHVGDLLLPGDTNLTSLLNTNPLINVIGFPRDQDISGATDTGSYGFYLGIRDPDGDTIFDRWAFKQVYAVPKVERFANTFYMAWEVDKEWGRRYPGQLNLGYILGNSDSFAVNTPSDNAYLFYGSVVQKYKRLTSYFRWGTLNTAFFGDAFTINHFGQGIFLDVTKRDTFGIHYTVFNTFFDNEDANYRNLLALHWRHNFNRYLYGLGFLEFNWDKPTPFGTEDSNFQAGLAVQAHI